MAKERMFFSENNIIYPDLIFDWTLCDPQVREDEGIGTPKELRENKKRGQIRGCYAMIDFGYKNPPIVLYVGRAVRLWNRIQTHFVNSSFCDKWYFDDCDKYGGTGIIEVAVWITDNAKQFEEDLIRTLNPLYNKLSR
jgi:hypothetical protein